MHEIKIHFQYLALNPKKMALDIRNLYEISKVFLSDLTKVSKNVYLFWGKLLV